MNREKNVIPIIPSLFIFTIILIAFSGLMTGLGYELRGHGIIAMTLTFLIGLPTIIAVGKYKEGIRLLLILGIYTYIIESIGVITGYPYGRFYYGEMMGYNLFGIVPIVLPLAYMPLAIGAYYIADKLSPNKAMIITLKIMMLLLFDLVLDPGAAALGYWIWENSGAYYGIPLTNYIGWIISSLITALICSYHYKSIRKANPKLILASPLLFMVYWTFTVIGLGMIIPSIIGIITIIVLGGFIVSPKARRYHHGNTFKSK
ncbi:MAG: carotenoid biosynthesis protein [Candidatus Woesearchaeota archaeon]